MKAHPSPAARAIEAHLRARRPRSPRILKATLVAGLVCVGVYGALLAFFYATNRALFDDMLRLYALTLLAGREPAMFAVYQPPTPVPLGWMMLVAVIDDVGTLLLTLPLVWFGFHRLHGVGRLERWMLGLQKAALENRRWIRRWGLGALAVFYWLPGLGSGVLAICVMGVVAHIPLRRLVPTLIASATGVALFWAVALHETSVRWPAGPLEWIPGAVIAAVVLLAGMASYRRRRTAYVLLLEWPPPTGDRARQLEPFGVGVKHGLVEVDSHLLLRRLRLERAARGHAHAIGELLLIDALPSDAAVALAQRSVGGIPDLATLDEHLVQLALHEARLPPDARARTWIAEAGRMASEAESGWSSRRGPRPIS